MCASNHRENTQRPEGVEQGSHGREQLERHIDRSAEREDRRPVKAEFLHPVRPWGFDDAVGKGGHKSPRQGDPVHRRHSRDNDTGRAIDEPELLQDEDGII